MSSIQGKYSFHLKATRQSCRKIVMYLKHQDCSGKMNNNFIRLHIPIDPEWTEYFMDQEGRVFDGTSEYVLNPYRYLKVVDYMDYLKTKNNVKEGGWTNRKNP